MKLIKIMIMMGRAWLLLDGLCAGCWVLAKERERRKGQMGCLGHIVPSKFDIGS